MRLRRHDFEVGLTAIALLVVFLLTFFFLNPWDQTPTRRLVVQFRHSDGVAPVRPGSPVLLSGAVTVGQVVGVRIDHRLIKRADGREARELMIVLDVDVDANLELHGNCKITTDQPAVGGGGSVVIVDVGTPGVPLDATQPIDGLPPQSLAATTAALNRWLLGPEGVLTKLDRLLDPGREDSAVFKVLSILTHVDAATAQLQTQLTAAEQQSLMHKTHRMLDDLTEVTMSLREQLARTRSESLVDKLHVVLDRLAESMLEVSGMLNENRAPIASTVARLEHIARRTDDELLAALVSELNADDPQTLLGKIHASMDRLDAALENLQTASAAGRDALLLNRPAIERTLANAREMSEQLRAASAEIRLAPWRLLYRPDARESRELTIFEAARTFAEAATHLDDAAGRLDAALDASADSPVAARDLSAEIESIRDRVRQAFQRFQSAEDFLWQNMR